ncbi:lantibiotic dehydratase [Chryseobacterium carnipullorum]|uniref:Lantibiotic dehydratase n=1 Tax=Chryseobacterium carnipullorum TaxID=1124835 RepID=A0A376EM05_CHRCU|nr:thiopeptide-type bacteriocin biosynthesis protein [Chryseobacterium carnipullorum]AZA47714.1 lantibiotic dehydratase [Chryseobacterium carnipullorum]AZA67038.1 lantibiotic dehydratase [Chryseobacterium carnipullorum]STD11476.1 thiopeptide-type bacteriocin biosynthesis domain [Chryseobacterium carnipullorum]
MTKRKFIPGTEWLYLKIYTGVKTADIILEEALLSLITDIQENNYISKWFFIRYLDPKPHIRLRFRLRSTEDYNSVIQLVKEALQQYLESGEIISILLDTYNREVERYGEYTMEESETLFHSNSELTLQCLHFDDEEKIIISLFLIDTFLATLGLSIQEKLDWIKDFNEDFKAEFHADKVLNIQLDKKYRALKPQFLNFLFSEEYVNEREFIILNIETDRAVLEKIQYHDKNESLGMPLKIFFQSIFHMNINRLFVSNQRTFEMIIYDYLLRYYKTNFWLCQ